METLQLIKTNGVFVLLFVKAYVVTLLLSYNSVELLEILPVVLPVKLLDVYVQMIFYRRNLTTRKENKNNNFLLYNCA